MTVLVTGAALRVGRSIALELADASLDVAIHYRESGKEAEEVAALAREKGVRAMTIGADLTRSGDIERLFGEVLSGLGRLDVLVNNAAVFRRTTPDRLDEAEFDFHMDINLKAPYLCSIEAARAMGTSGGCIINLADVAWDRPFRNYVPYCVSKAGLVMLTRAMAKAYAPGIRVNAIAPGTVLFREDEDPETRDAVTARIPRGRVGTPGDVARLVRFLCLEADHVTGAVIPVDGGRALD